MIGREAIAAALFAKLQNAAKFVTVSRRLKHWVDVAAADQPALFVTQRDEDIKTTPGLNPVSLIMADVYVYANTAGDKLLSPSTILNPLMDAIVTSLAPEVMSNKQTLGGLVQHCWIEGKVQTDEGVLGDQGVLIIPIVMKAA